MLYTSASTPHVPARMVRRDARRATLAPLATAIALLVAGCGSSSSHSAASTVSTQTSTLGATSTTTTSTPSAAPGATKTPTSTTTAPAPGATGGAVAPGGTGGASTHAAGLSGAEAVVSRQGYTASDPSEYHSGQTLRVLVGVRTGSADARVQRAFFFVNDRYIGTDTGDTSATIAVTAQDDTSVTLRYGIYKHGDPLCCPSSTASVRYTLDNGHLSPNGQIPPASMRNGG